MDIILFVAIIAVIVFIFMIYIIDDDHDLIIPFIILLATLVVTCIIFGSETSNKKELKKPITPSLHIECDSSKCDTTYVYQF